MNSQLPPRRGLGRGLGALIPTAPAPAPTEDERVGELGSGSDVGTDADYETGSTEGTGSLVVDASAEPQQTSDEPATAQVREPSAGASPVAQPVPPLSPAVTTPVATDSGADPGPEPESSREADRAADSLAVKVEGAEVALPPADSLPPVEGASFAEIPIEQITANPRQPRQVFEEEALAELEYSIREIGLLQPIVVRRTATDGYELIMGERRWRAAQRAGLRTIPAIVRETDDQAMLRDALLENLHRAQLNPLEEAAAYQQLLDDFGCTQEELAHRIGRSRPQIGNTLRLLRLSPAVQRRVAAGVLSAGHARALLGVADANAQDLLAGRVVAEGISVRGLEEIVAVGASAGDPDVKERRSFAAPRTGDDLSEVADRLSDRLETRVQVHMGRQRGKIAIDFATLEDLHRIVAVIDPRNRSDRPI